jgi:hypothetical protein
VLDPRCPICGHWWCWREISAYERTVIELYPFRKETVPVARFQCRETGRTFSLLPCELAPYHLYTIESMIRLLLAVGRSTRGVATTVIDECPESNVCPWLVACWVRAFVVGLERARHVLRGEYALDDLATDGGLRGVVASLEAFSRDPPPVVSMWCWKQIGMPLVGTPSQHRCAS